MKKILGILVFTITLAGYLVIETGDTFATEYNLKNLTRLIAFLAILGIGESLVITTGGIDLSVGSIVGYTALLLTWLIGTKALHPISASVIVFLIATATGTAHGVLVTKTRLQPFIATLAGMMILRGLAQVLTQGGAVGIGPGHDTFQEIGNGFLFGLFPIPVMIMLLVAAIFTFLMHFTVFGRHLYAIGRNEEAARFSGIHTGRCKAAAYVLSAWLACLTGILYASYLSSVQTNFGNAFELYAIAAAVLGGVSLRGGEGTVIGVIIGAALMRIIYNGINLLGISTHTEYAVIGSVILIAALMDAFLHRKAA